MFEHTAGELAYKNGFEAGVLQSARMNDICTRIEVAYEQLGKVHTELCKTGTRGEDDELIYDIQDILNAILKVEVKLGMIKQEEDIK